MIGMKRILRVKWLAFWFALVIIMGLSGCEKSEPLPVEVQIEFSADRTTIQPGECARLTWRVEGGFGVYDAPQPWGPWTTAFFAKRWDVGPGETSSFPTKWISRDGRTIHLVFSGDDHFSVRKATLEITQSPDK